MSKRLDIKHRLQRYDARTGENAWVTFVELREKLKRQGSTDAEAWNEAGEHYPEDRYPSDKPTNLPSVPPTRVSSVSPTEASPVGAEKPPVPVNGSSQDRFSLGEDSAPSTLPEKIDWKTLNNDAKAEKGSAREVASGNINYRASIEWVYQNIDRPNVRPEDAPDAGAWSILRQCRESETFRKDFYKTWLMKLMPSQKEFDRDNRYHDNGDEMVAFIERVEEEAKNAQYEGAGVSVN